MKIEIELSRPRWARLPRTWRTRTLAAVLAAGVVAVPAVWASHLFGDVPSTNPHHDDITAIRFAGITQGCNPPTNDMYCPEQAVRRDQMASFLRRGLGRAVYSQQVLNTMIPFSAEVGAGTLVAQVIVPVPGVGTTVLQFAKVDAHLNFEHEAGPLPYNLAYFLAESSCQAPTARSTIFRDVVHESPPLARSASLSWVRGAPPGSRTFLLCAYTTSSGATARVAGVTLAASTYPFAG